VRHVVLLFIILTGTAFAKVWVVDTTGAEGEKLQSAIDSAWQDPGIDTVLVKDGTYHLFINDTVGLIMRDSVVLMSENGAEKCTLTALSEDGSDTAWHVIYCSGWDTASHAALIKGFTIKDGNATGPSSHTWGGGIYIYSASPTIDSCIITNNSASGGGGIFIYYYSSPALLGNTITNNYADAGSGIFIWCHSSPTVSGNTIANNHAYYGGGIFISDYSSPTVSGNTITNNYVNNYGGGIFITDYSSPLLSCNTIINNHADDGGGIYISFSSFPILTGNTITNNRAFVNGGGVLIELRSSPTLLYNAITDNLASYGSGIFIACSSPVLLCNTISNNLAHIVYRSSFTLLCDAGITNHICEGKGGIFICDSASPTLSYNTITNNSADCGSGIFITNYSSVKITKCVIGMNKSNYGGAIYDTLHSKIIIDSSFIVDNAGLAYIASDADSGVTFKLTYSHIYYNTLQQDTEIKNFSGVTINLENNFWWDTTDAEISAKISGANDHTPWFSHFIPGVPGEPVSIDSLKNYDKDFSQVVDSLGKEDTLYIRVYGQDRDAHIHEIAVVIIKSSVYPQGIAVGLIETDTNSGIYEGKAYVLESTGNDDIRDDDINQIIRVNPDGDDIFIISNIEPQKKFYVKYKKGAGIKEISVEKFKVSNMPNPFSKFTKIKYQLPKEEKVRIEIMDITGRLIKVLVDEKKSPGYYSVTWKGEDARGKNVPPGIYFYLIKAGKNKAIKKMIKLK